MIGVTHFNNFRRSVYRSLKRDALFFDKIAMVGISSMFEKTPGRSNEQDYHAILNEVDFLARNDFLHIFSETPTYGVEKKSWFDSVMITTPEDIPLEHVLETVSDSILARSAAISLAEQQSLEVVCIDPIPPFVRFPRILPHSSPTEASLTSGDLIQLAIDRVPLVSDLTPWEQIFEMKKDEDLLRKSRKLRIWAREFSKLGLSADEAGDYIDDLLDDYERHLALHTKKYSAGMIETAIVGSAGIVEDIIKLRLDKLSKRIFSVSQQKNNLLLAELEAPGREISIISKLRKNFSA